MIVWTSIPLSILTAIIGLHWLNETINVMTLGGLALAVGILVDDATVMIENIDRHIEMGKPLEQAIIDANQIVVPTLVATLCIAIVWIRSSSLVASLGTCSNHGRGGHHCDARLLHSITHVGANDGEIYEESPCPQQPHGSHAQPSRNVLSAFRRGLSVASINSARATVRCSNT